MMPVGRLSTITCWARLAVRPWAMTRATRSVVPPTAEVTMRTGRVGNSCACTAPQSTAPADRIGIRQRNITGFSFSRQSERYRASFDLHTGCRNHLRPLGRLRPDVRGKLLGGSPRDIEPLREQIA